jgi:hypothetical protein
MSDLRRDVIGVLWSMGVVMCRGSPSRKGYAGLCHVEKQSAQRWLAWIHFMKMSHVMGRACPYWFAAWLRNLKRSHEPVFARGDWGGCYVKLMTIQTQVLCYVFYYCTYNITTGGQTGPYKKKKKTWNNTIQESRDFFTCRKYSMCRNVSLDFWFNSKCELPLVGYKKKCLMRADIYYGVGEIYKSFFTSHKPCKLDALQNYWHGSGMDDFPSPFTGLQMPF